MQKDKLTALTKMRYDRRSLVSGDEFEANKKDADVLVKIGKAKRGGAGKYQTRVMTPATEPVPAPAQTMTASSTTLHLPKKAEPTITTVGAQTARKPA